MKLSYRTQPYKNYDIETALKQLANLGYDGVELCLEHPDTTVEKLTDEKIAHVKDLLRKNSLGLSSVSLHCNFVDDDDCFSELKKAIPSTRKFDADLLVISTGTLSGSEAKAEKQKTTLRSRIGELLALCDANRVTLALEPEPDFIISSTADMLKLIEDMGHDRLKCNLDIGHAHITDPSLTEAIELLGEKIVHTHIEDIKDKKHYHLMPGDGDIDLSAVLKALSGIGFEGYLTLDLFNFDPAVAAEPSLTYLKKLI